MTACHRRIERFLKTLCFAAEHAGKRQLTPEETEALSRALHYFREAAPHHVADEEQDLFPALARLDPDATRAINRLELDHQRAGEWHARVNMIGEHWLLEGRISAADLDAFRDTSARLEALYAEHILVEEKQVFPRAAHLLSELELGSIGRKMASRRRVTYLPKHSGLPNHRAEAADSVDGDQVPLGPSCSNRMDPGA